jgi:hypothetical protein
VIQMTVQKPIVRLAADWDCSGVVRQTPGERGEWDSIHFTTEPVRECDYLIMFNNRCLDAVQARCPRENVWCIIQEPYLPGLYDWIVEGHEPFARVFTHHVPSADPKYVRSFPILPWGVGLTYDELLGSEVPVKTRGVSWIASNLNFLPGHRRRRALREFLIRVKPDAVDIYGRGIRYIKLKWDALAPYRYSLAIENSNSADYWTEKVADCFLSWTVPLYDGCTNLEDYFSADSFVRIDARDHAGTLRKIEELLRSDEWERRLPAVRESRARVLSEYQMFPALARAIHSYGTDARERELVCLPDYRSTRWKHRARYLTRKVRDGEYADLLAVSLSKLRYLRWFNLGRPDL